MNYTVIQNRLSLREIDRKKIMNTEGASINFNQE
jgi:hypothetical protein